MPVFAYYLLAAYLYQCNHSAAELATILLELKVLVLVDASGEMFPIILVFLKRFLRGSTNLSTHEIHRVLNTIQWDEI